MFEINQGNLHLILPGKISWMAKYLCEDSGCGVAESLERIYHSEVYSKLADESTKYWHLGPVDLYGELRAELDGKAGTGLLRRCAPRNDR